jgi:hypothetical protein
MQYREAVEIPKSRWFRLVTIIGRFGLAAVPFAQVAHFLAFAPEGDERAMLAFFIPPIVASMFVLADNGRFNSTFVRAAWLLLTVLSFAAMLAQTQFLPIKPQFPALPAPLDRVLVFYLAGWYAYVLVVCPLWFLYWRLVSAGSSLGPVGVRFVLGSIVWSMGVATIVYYSLCKLF